MSAEPQYAKTPQECLEEADRLFDAGNKREGSKLVWQAVKTALAAIADQRGLPLRNNDDAFSLAVILDKEDGYTREHIGNYAVSEGFHDNSREVWEEDNYDLSLYYWDDLEFTVYRPIAAKFVHYLLAKADKGTVRQ